MSKLRDLRLALKNSLVAANIGWDLKTILIERQGDLWNDIASAIERAKHGAVLVIGSAKGTPLDDGRTADQILTIPVTILAEPNVRPSADPEEDLWEAMVKHITGLQLDPDGLTYQAFKFAGWEDLSEETPGYLSRQTLFTTSLYL